MKRDRASDIQAERENEVRIPKMRMRAKGKYDSEECEYLMCKNASRINPMASAPPKILAWGYGP